MTKTLEATFDGEVIHLNKPLELEPNIRVRVTIETSIKQKEKNDLFSKPLNL